VENLSVFAVKGFYDGNSVVVEEPIPVKEQYKVIVTFVSSMASKNKKRNYCEKLQELNGSIKDTSFAEQRDIPSENNLPRDFL
jgi:hypothetical protein